MTKRIFFTFAILTEALGFAPSFAHAGSELGIRKVVQIVTGRTPLDPFRRPQGVVADTTRGIVLVSDSGNHRVVTFDSRWRTRGSIAFPSPYSREPLRLALDARKRIFLADGMAHEIVVLSALGTPITSFLPRLSETDTAFVTPQDIAISSSGRIFVLLSGDEPGIVVLEANGSRAEGFESAPSRTLQSPQAIAVNADESLIAVADPFADQPVVLFNGKGERVSSFGSHGEVEGGSSLAIDVTWAPDGTLWVTDNLRHSISVFTSRGECLGKIGGFGYAPGQFAYPVSCEFLAPDRILVLEQANARFQVLEVGIPSLEEGTGRLETAGSALVGTERGTP